MDIDARIERRRRRGGEQRLVRDYDALSPVAHLDEPVGRGPVVERLLDHLDPVFDGTLPPNAYVHGPFGAGKSAVVTALFERLAHVSTRSRDAIYTTTRARSSATPRFVYVDLRETSSEFAFYHRVLDALADDPVPEHGVGTEEIRARLHGALDASRMGVVVAVDHVDAPGVDDADLVAWFAGLPSNASWLAVGRRDPADVALCEYTARDIAVDAYQRRVLIDVLMTRASSALARQALGHTLARRIAEWADGNAHDALAALFAAVDHAANAQRDRVREADVTAALADVPHHSVSLGTVFALPENKRLVLRKLVDLDQEDRRSVTATTEAVAADPAVDLSPGTIKRYLYEMAEVGVVERVQTAERMGKGRTPSRVELGFAPTVFRRLYDLRQ
ncbi:AAA family ATPase [Halarchaeum sp. CBA1220]|uniref:Cdc6/Cdc18 family protein n=1 Tax=Halarchaeum sp. CBA1220 TaxID=1853682 RepID=UPI000F3A86A8|nr:AAA family ATPase [Halarchaeum sp. CBA1220]QLC34417.1 AAA family ATPase [Halarchaeum sp. CBA1220]